MAMPPRQPEEEPLFLCLPSPWHPLTFLYFLLWFFFVLSFFFGCMLFFYNNLRDLLDLNLSRSLESEDRLSLLPRYHWHTWRRGSADSVPHPWLYLAGAGSKPFQHERPKAPQPSTNLQLSSAPIKRVRCHADGEMDDERCCVWHQIRNDLQSNNFFLQCGFDVPDVLRLAFHDAISYSKTDKKAGGGADGSMVIFQDELNYAENVELIGSVQELFPYIARYNVSAGDIVQFAAMVGVSNCPGSPQFRFLAGRPPPKGQSPDGFVPGATESVTKILHRMEDAGFTSQELVALLASHSVGRADTVDPMIPGNAFDSTPYQFDGQFYLETLFKANGWPGTKNIDPASGEVESGMAPQGEIRLSSDARLARDHRTACDWQSYVDNQSKLSKDFGEAMFKVSMLGQHQYAHKMHDCSGALQKPPRAIKRTTYPGGYSYKDVQKSCKSTPFPNLKRDAGIAPKIPLDID